MHKSSSDVFTKMVIYEQTISVSKFFNDLGLFVLHPPRHSYNLFRVYLAQLTKMYATENLGHYYTLEACL